jgi:hypothetical protein
MQTNLNFVDTTVSKDIFPLSIPEVIATELVSPNIVRYTTLSTNGPVTLPTPAKDLQTIDTIMGGFEVPYGRNRRGCKPRFHVVHVTLDEIRLLKRHVCSALRAKRRALKRQRGECDDHALQTVRQFRKFAQELNSFLYERGDGRSLSEWRDDVLSHLPYLEEEFDSIIDEESIIGGDPESPAIAAGQMADEFERNLLKFASKLRSLQLP